MENQQFVQRLHDKIERLTKGRIDLEIDIEDGNQLRVGWNGRLLWWS